MVNCLLNYFRLCSLVVILILIAFPLASQSSIDIYNGSFEKDSHQASKTPFGWYPYGDPKISSPDIHSRYYTYFEVEQTPSDGDRFISLVTRKDWSTEGLCQFLAYPMLSGGKYRLKLDLCFSNDFQSKIKNDTLTKFENPARLEVWGFNRSTEADSLLAFTPIVDHSEWRTYSLILNTSMQVNDLCLLATYPQDALIPNPANILIDNIQELEQIYAHPALPADSELLKEKPIEDLATIIEKLEPELISSPGTSSQLKILLSVSNVEAALKNQTVQNYIYNEERKTIIKHIKIMEAIGANKLADIIRRAFRSFIQPKEASQEDIDFFTSVNAIYEKESEKKSLLKSKLDYLKIHKENFIEEIKIQLY